jgi:hypothetical protein
LYQSPRKAISAFWRPPPDLLLEDPVVGRPTPAWAPRRAMRRPDIHSVDIRPVFLPICKRSRIVRVGLQEGWYPPNTEVHLSRTRVPGVLGESGFASWVAGVSPIYANPLGRRFWHFRVVLATSRGRIATRGAVRGPRAHGPRCERQTSILGLSGAVEHAGGAGRVSFVDPRRSPFRALGLAQCAAPERSALRPNLVPVDRGAVLADLDVLGCVPRAIETTRPSQHSAHLTNVSKVSTEISKISTRKSAR